MQEWARENVVRGQGQGSHSSSGDQGRRLAAPQTQRAKQAQVPNRSDALMYGDLLTVMASTRVGKSLLDKFRQGDLVSYHTSHDRRVFRVEEGSFFDGSTFTGAPVVLLSCLSSGERVTECVLALKSVSPLEALGMQAE